MGEDPAATRANTIAGTRNFIIMLLNIKYEFGDIVYLKTDLDQHPGVITGLQARPGGSITYEITRDDYSDWYYPEEISKDKAFLK